jgi:hypothetical protein
VVFGAAAFIAACMALFPAFSPLTATVFAAHETRASAAIRRQEMQRQMRILADM